MDVRRRARRGPGSYSGRRWRHRRWYRDRTRAARSPGSPGSPLALRLGRLLSVPLKRSHHHRLFSGDWGNSQTQRQRCLRLVDLSTRTANVRPWTELGDSAQLQPGACRENEPASQRLFWCYSLYDVRNTCTIADYSARHSRSGMDMHWEKQVRACTKHAGTPHERRSSHRFGTRNSVNTVVSKAVVCFTLFEEG